MQGGQEGQLGQCAIVAARLATQSTQCAGATIHPPLENHALIGAFFPTRFPAVLDAVPAYSIVQCFLSHWLLLLSFTKLAHVPNSLRRCCLPS